MNRTGTINFGDASLVIWEDNVDEKSFKKDVFKRIVQQLNRMGWAVEVPAEMIEQYGYHFACRNRSCRKGDLRAKLSLCGRCIELQMWQGVNTPTRPDHGGQYEFNKEVIMPYLLRVRMEWTRRRLRDYLCNVFDGYQFGRYTRDKRPGPGGITAVEHVDRWNRESGHYKPELGRAAISMPGYSDRSAEGETITHGAAVYTTDAKGRVITGTAYYQLNSRWWVVAGRHSVTCVDAGEIFLRNPGDLRRKRNQRRRRGRLESELTNAIGSMNFERAAVLKRILFGDATLFRIWSVKESAWFGPNYSGYTADPNAAGKYTAAEIENSGYVAMIKRGALKQVPIDQPRAAA